MMGRSHISRLVLVGWSHPSVIVPAIFVSLRGRRYVVHALIVLGLAGTDVWQLRACLRRADQRARRHCKTDAGCSGQPTQFIFLQLGDIHFIRRFFRCISVKGTQKREFGH